MATQLRPLHSEDEYQDALAEVERLWDSEEGTEDGDRLEVLTVLIDAYESEHHAIELPDPIEAIKARMDDLGIDRAKLGAMIHAGSGRVSEILNRRRPLTLDMIRTLSKELGLSERCLLQSYPLAQAPFLERAVTTVSDVVSSHMPHRRSKTPEHA